MPSGLDVTSNDVKGNSPFGTGRVKLTVAFVSPLTAVTLVGAPGGGGKINFAILFEDLPPAVVKLPPT